MFMRQFEDAYLWRRIDEFDWLLLNRPGVVRDRGAYLAASITDRDRPSPKGYRSARDREIARQDAAERQREEEMDECVRSLEEIKENVERWWEWQTMKEQSALLGEFAADFDRDQVLRERAGTPFGKNANIWAMEFERWKRVRLGLDTRWTEAEKRLNELAEDDSALAGRVATVTSAVRAKR